LEFKGRQIDLIATATYFMASFVDHQIADLDSIAISHRLDSCRTPEQGLDPVFQFAWTKWLCQIVMAPASSLPLCRRCIMGRQE
jgi:hypothetical protein